MEAIQSIRQMMAEQKFYEAQKQIEAQLSFGNDHRHELLTLLLECLTQQNKDIPSGLLIDLSEKELELKNYETALDLISELNSPEHQLRCLKVRLMVADERGQIKSLFQLVSNYLLSQFEHQIPHIPVWCFNIIEKFFKHDFSIQLKVLAIELAVNNLEKAEQRVKELIISSVERSSAKGVKERFISLSEILNASIKGHLEIYRNFCVIYSSGITDKSEYKRIIEMVIYFDDFQLQALVLNILDKLELKEEAQDFAAAIKENKNYSYVYFDKYLPHLKPYFFKSTAKTIKEEKAAEVPDLKLTDRYRSPVLNDFETENDPEEILSYLNLLKHQEYTVNQLCDLAVSFLQSEMPKVALKASERGMELSSSDEEFLKASFLKVSALFVLKDFRAALDTCLIALEKAQTTDDILSFMYAQGEAYIRLGQTRDAKKILKKIIQIDAGYRLAQERLDKLNEI